MKKRDKIMIIGIGNNTREDDGLGWSFIETLENMNLGFSEDQLKCKYQLMVEDAEEIIDFETVYFVDACKTPITNGFEIEEVKPADHLSFSTHSVPPDQLLHLCMTVYDRHPKAYVIKIYGEKWDIKIGLSPQAKINLDKAVTGFKELL